MFISENRRKTISIALVASVMLFTTASFAKEYIATEVIKNNSNPVFPANKEKGIDGGVVYKVKDNMYTVYAINNQEKKGFKYGRTPTKNEEKAWDVDVMPDGTGLPEGKGSVEQGDELYEEKCSMCHGEFGSGGKGSRSTYPTLSIGEASTDSLTNQRINPDVDGPKRVIGTYWPQASTLFWYIKTAMPFPHPKSLNNDEVYALVAYLLSVNDITIDGQELDDEYVLDRAKFLKIKMPNEDGFIPKIDGPKGAENIKKFLGNPKNYGNGTRCMKNCIDGEPNVVRIKKEIHKYEPPVSVVRDLPKEITSSKEVHPGQKIYETSCAVCHATDAMGAPNVGNKEAWAKKLEKGIDKVYENGIKGINAMPPKGGTSLSDEDFKKAVDYMIDNSK
ncbi:MAG: c-type cytochrome [Epsilonproteobacteria bacterium]|nr:c-type cytochrome [Campylobacterota bacterium]